MVSGLQVSQGFGAWAVHCFVLKALMYMLGTSNAIPFLELLAYAGYPFVPICTSLLARLTLGQHYNTWTLCLAPNFLKEFSGRCCQTFSLRQASA